MQRHYKHWTKEEVSKLRLLWTTHTVSQIAKILRRTQKSVISKALALKLKISDKEVREDYSWTTDYKDAFWWKHYTKEEDDFIRENYLKMEYKQIAQILGRKPSGIACRVRKLGLWKGAHPPKKAKRLIPDYIDDDKFYYNYQMLEFFNKHKNLMDFICNKKFLY